MLALEVVAAVAVLLAVAFIATRERGLLDDEPTDHPDIGLPDDRVLRSEDIGALRFRVVSSFWGGLRGYRFDDVDATMAKVEEALRTHEQRPARLPPGPPPSSVPRPE